MNNFAILNSGIATVCRGCYVDTVGKNATKIREYIRKQL